MIVIYYLLLIVAIEMNARYDAYQIKEHRKISHSLRTILRGFFFTFNSLLIIPVHYWSPKYLMFASILHQAAIWWIVFDIRLNKLRGLHWAYIGKTALLDKIFDNNIIYQLFAKFILLLLSIYFLFMF